MKKTSTVLNTLAALLSAAFFLYTFVAEKHLESLAREFVTAKTLDYSKSLFDLAEKSLQSPLAKQLIPKAAEKAIEKQMDSYENDPVAYIQDLTRSPRIQRKTPNFLKPGSKVEAFKTKVREYYDETMAALIRDLRIFSGTNLTVSLLALLLILRSPEKFKKQAFWFSLLLFVAVVSSSYLYIDGMGFFSILFKWHLGWFYPVLLLITFFQFVFEYRRPAAKEDSFR